MQVRVRTGDVRGAGTDADISVILMGSKGQSQEIPLESSHDNFERNKVCEWLDWIHGAGFGLDEVGRS